MNIFQVDALLRALFDLSSLENTLACSRENGQGGRNVPDEVFKSARRAVESVRHACIGAEFSRVVRTAATVGSRLKDMASIDISTLEAELRHVRSDLLLEGLLHSFVVIPEAKKEYVDNRELLGEGVSDAFPQARQDIIDAGNCLALDCPTAAVFHLMRIAEHGLRSLSKRFHVRLTDKGRRQPVEFAEWGKVLDAIKNEIARARALAKGQKRQAKLEMFSDAADHCVFMKDIWRNSVSHTRNSYKESEAVAVLDRVRDFMQFLAKTTK